MPRSALMLFSGLCLSMATCVLAVAEAESDDRGRGYRDRGHQRSGEYKERYWEGPCKVEREQKSDGSYKEERECKASATGPTATAGGEYEEKYSTGPCKVEREWKRDGTYKEKLDCKGHGQ